jgi:hypothetical protein
MNTSLRTPRPTTETAAYGAAERVEVASAQISSCRSPSTDRGLMPTDDGHTAFGHRAIEARHRAGIELCHRAHHRDRAARERIRSVSYGIFRDKQTCAPSPPLGRRRNCPRCRRSSLQRVCSESGATRRTGTTSTVGAAALDEHSESLDGRYNATWMAMASTSAFQNA